SVVFIIASLCAIVPLIFVVIISFTSKESIASIGYSFMPESWSIEGYKTLWDTRASIGTSFMISIFITLFGTVVGLFLNATMGYVLSRRSFKLRKLYTWIVFIPMIFNGGMVANFVVMRNILHLDNNLLSLILPLAVTSFYVIILRTFFTTTVPDSLIESAKIDGASQLRIFFQIVLPISLPALATIGLFLSFAYWNDWFQAMLYIDNEDLFPLQYVLVKIDRQIDFMIRNSTAMGMSAMEMLDKMPQDAVKMAMVVVAVVPIACSYPFFQRYFVSGLTIGAVKG
ncbi:MAG: carbohydrate ABC transporter permease, partial [Oscillospiraceae bacterium]